MSIVAVASLHGAPGATTLAAGLASSLGDAVLVEADPAGGVLAARCGLAREPGLVTFAADREAIGRDGLDRHAQRAENGLAVLPCPESAEHTTTLLRAAGDDVAHRLSSAGRVVVDLGRLGVDGTADPVLERAAALVLVTHPTIDALAVLVARLERLRHHHPVVALVGDRPYVAAEVIAELGVELGAVIAVDPRATDELWSGGGRRLARSAWARSVRALASDLSHVGTTRDELVP